MRALQTSVGIAARSFSQLLMVRFFLHQCIERGLGVQWEVQPPGWTQVVTVRYDLVKDPILVFFLRIRMVDVIASAQVATFTLKIWFFLVPPHFFYRTATWAALSITKANFDINPEILMKTNEMLMETLGSGSRSMCARQQLAEMAILKAWVKHI